MSTVNETEGHKPEWNCATISLQHQLSITNILCLNVLWVLLARVLALAKHTQDSVALGLDLLCARDPKFSVLVVRIQRMLGGNSRKG